MPSKHPRGDLTSFVLGAAIGAGLVMLRNQRARRDPYRLTDQKRINRSLDCLLEKARDEANIPLPPKHRFVIFSDHHKGSGDRADDFRNCRKTYLTALENYYQRGFTLIILGDAEELWEDSIQNVLATYADVFESERRFHPDRYLRVVGNHDNFWENRNNVETYLQPFFPGIQIYSGLVMSYNAGLHTTGDIFLAHGHQGTIDAEALGFITPVVLPIYRRIQNLTGIGQTSPSKNECLVGEHDTRMYRWASQKKKLLMIAGHTHRPVWSSRTHLEKLLWQLGRLFQIEPDQRPLDYEDQITNLQAEIKKREEKSPPCNDTIKTRPCYYNTGCCRFADGDITGIELEDGELRLVKWGAQQGEIRRIEFENNHLTTIFSHL